MLHIWSWKPKYVMNSIPVTESAARVLEGAKEYLEYLTEEAYARPLEVLGDASIGQHTRHFIEFFGCLLAQCKAGSAIDYDSRQRDLLIETQPAIAQAKIEAIQEALHDLPDQACCLQTTYEGAEPVVTNSSLHREVLYNIEHTIHHFAIIRIGLRICAPDLQLSEHFGVAASTIRYRQTVPQK